MPAARPHAGLVSLVQRRAGFAVAALDGEGHVPARTLAGLLARDVVDEIRELLALARG
jgi:hypothetical protein